VAEKIVGDDQAASFAARKPRAGFEIPRVIQTRVRSNPGSPNGPVSPGFRPGLAVTAIPRASCGIPALPPGAF
jgi:hypothetical protein